MAAAPATPLVLFVAYLMILLLLIGLIATFLRSKYFHYKDMELLMCAFILFVVMVFLYTVLYGGQTVSFNINAYSELLIRGLGSFAAWLLAIDVYRNATGLK